ncbi:MAG: acyl transferase [Cytophagales bacterium]|nr:acyl transferase [Cytophagales bacterium]
MKAAEEIARLKKKLLCEESFDFSDFSLQVFELQARCNEIYKEYINRLGINPRQVDSVEKIPFLPIAFFKTHAVKTGIWESTRVFESSGTTGSVTSKHFVQDLDFYFQVARKIFERTYGPLTESVFLGLLPSYLERANSSLVAMVDHFIKESRNGGGFFLNDFEQLRESLEQLREQPDKQAFLIGVTFGLLDFSEKHSVDLTNIRIMETGGMKGRREELIRPEVHRLLQRSFGKAPIHSEYGMTELLSQAYSKGKGIFSQPFSMRVLLREFNDPFSYTTQRSGGVNIIDLANIHSCSFIETQDIGKFHKGGFFEILGRFDNSDVRGCNLMAV